MLAHDRWDLTRRLKGWKKLGLGETESVSIQRWKIREAVSWKFVLTEGKILALQRAISGDAHFFRHWNYTIRYDPAQ